jgi:hypothetical protein
MLGIISGMFSAFFIHII